MTSRRRVLRSTSQRGTLRSRSSGQPLQKRKRQMLGPVQDPFEPGHVLVLQRAAGHEQPLKLPRDRVPLAGLQRRCADACARRRAG